MKNTKRIASAAACIAAMLAAMPLGAAAEGEEFSGYVLMNIPYSEFYAAENAEIGDVDAISSATNKVGNYGKAGGAYHSGTTAEIAEDGTVTAVGTQNGAKVQGVTWAVKADSLEAVQALGGVEITDESTVTTATFGKGNTTSNTLVGYEVLTEAPAYSYYVLDSVPENYLILDGTSFTSATNAASSGAIDAEVSYATKWGDVELDLSTAENANGKIINAMILTADDGTTKGFYHIGQIWAYSELAWNVSDTPELDGKTITNVRYYCSDKDTDLTDGTAPAYANYVYDYQVNEEILTVYTGEVTAEFTDAATISIAGLPDDIENPTVTVSSVVGRGETAVVIAESAAIADGVVTTTEAGVFETSYKVVVKSDNYGDISVTIPCNIESAASDDTSTDSESTDTEETTDTENTTDSENITDTEDTTDASDSAESDKTTTTTADEAEDSTTTTTASAANNAASSPNTGVAGLAVPAAMLAMAGTALFVSKKRN